MLEHLLWFLATLLVPLVIVSQSLTVAMLACSDWVTLVLPLAMAIATFALLKIGSWHSLDDSAAVEPKETMIVVKFNGECIAGYGLHACRPRDDQAGLDCLSYG